MIRLSLLFNHEDPVRHAARIELAKSRMRTAEDEMRFLKFIDALPLDAKAKLQPQWRREILNYTLRRPPSAAEFKLSEEEAGKQLKDLLGELEIDYIR